MSEIIRHGPAGDDEGSGPAQLVEQLRLLSKRTSAAARAYWLPLILFGALICGSLPFYEKLGAQGTSTRFFRGGDVNCPPDQGRGDGSWLLLAASVAGRRAPDRLVVPLARAPFRAAHASQGIPGHGPGHQRARAAGPAAHRAVGLARRSQARARHASIRALWRPDRRHHRRSPANLATLRLIGSVPGLVLLAAGVATWISTRRATTDTAQD